MSTEKWRPVVGYKGLYEVSDQGRIYSHYMKGVMSPVGHPYPAVNLWKDGVGSPSRVHEVVAAAFIGPRPKGMQINHKDLDKTNNSVSNLEYVTPQANHRHAVENGAIPKGEDHAHATITEKVALSIIDRYSSGETRRQIVDDLGLTFGQVSRIINGDRWSHLDRPSGLCDRGPDMPKGQNHPGAKLTTRQVEAILDGCASGASYSELADRYEVTPTLIGLIARGKAWSHMPRPKMPSIPAIERRALARLKNPPRNASGYKGVYKHGGGKWAAKIRTTDGSEYLGSFDSTEDAARAYDRRAREEYGDSVYLNFP